MRVATTPSKANSSSRPDRSPHTGAATCLPRWMRYAMSIAKRQLKLAQMGEEREFLNRAQRPPHVAPYGASRRQSADAIARQLDTLPYCSTFRGTTNDAVIEFSYLLTQFFAEDGLTPAFSPLADQTMWRSPYAWRAKTTNCAAHRGA